MKDFTFSMQTLPSSTSSSSMPEILMLLFLEYCSFALAFSSTLCIVDLTAFISSRRVLISAFNAALSDFTVSRYGTDLDAAPHAGE